MGFEIILTNHEPIALPNYFDTRNFEIELHYDRKIRNLQKPFFRNQRLENDIFMRSRHITGVSNIRPFRKHGQLQYVTLIRSEYMQK